MYIQLMQALITSVFALYSLTPVWCDSCGQIALAEEARGYYSQATTCEVCGAHLCGTCADHYDGAGCYVCSK